MSVINNEKRVTEMPGLKIKSRSKASDAVIYFDNVNTAPTTTAGTFVMYATGGEIYWDNGSSAVQLSGSAGGGGTPTFETIQSADTTFNLSTEPFSIAQAGAFNLLALNKTNVGAGAVIDITNAGSGVDIDGHSSNWSITSAGVITATGLTMLDSEVITLGTGSDATIQWDGSKTAVTGVIDFANNITMAANATVVQTGLAGSTVYTITAGDVVMSDGSLALTDADNAESVTIINNTATTIGAAASAGVVQVESTSLTTGAAVNVQLTEGTLAGGFYYSAWDATAGARVFSVGENGDLAVTGTAGSNALAITAGDAVLSDGSLTLTDADNATSLAATNNTATTASVATITANGLTTGTALTLTSTGTIVTTGEMLSVVANSATTSTGLVRVSGTGLTEGVLASLTGGGANMTSDGSVLDVVMGAATDGAGVFIETTGVYTGTGGVLEVSASSATTGNIVTIDGTGLTSGTALLINATTATLTTGYYIECNDGAASDFLVADNGATTIAGASAVAGLTVSAGYIVLAGTSTLTGSGAVPITHAIAEVDSTGGGAWTLADGVEGQRLTIVMVTDAGDGTLTPTSPGGYSTITFADAGDSVDLLFTNGNWYIIGQGGLGTGPLSA